MSTNVIVDTGCANLSSVKFAVERLGFQATITDDIEQIKSADKVILPGVGNAKHAMANIIEKSLVETLQSLTQPVLGFCLGMQLMAESSTEGKESSIQDNKVNCLGLIPTQVSPLNAKGNRLPHMGWNEIELKKDCFLFSNIKNKSHVYFIHSYEFMTKEKDCVIATTNYGNSIIVSIEKENIVGTQFHPEKSQKNGLIILENFLKWKV